MICHFMIQKIQWNYIREPEMISSLMACWTCWMRTGHSLIGQATIRQPRLDCEIRNIWRIGYYILSISVQRMTEAMIILTVGRLHLENLCDWLGVMIHSPLAQIKPSFPRSLYEFEQNSLDKVISFQVKSYHFWHRSAII